MQEAKIEFIENTSRSYIESYSTRNILNKEENISLIKNITSFLKADETIDPLLTFKLRNSNDYRPAIDFVAALLIPGSRFKNENFITSKFWSENDAFIKGILTKENLYLGSHLYFLWLFITSKLTSEHGNSSRNFIDYLHNIGITDEILLQQIMRCSSNPFVLNDETVAAGEIEKESGVAEYLKPLLKDGTSLFGLRKNLGLGGTLQQFVKEQSDIKSKFAILKFLYENAPEYLEGNFHNYLDILSSQNTTAPDYACTDFLLERDYNRFEPIVVEHLKKYNSQLPIVFNYYMMLNRAPEFKYEGILEGLGENFLNKFVNFSFKKDSYYRFDSVNGGSAEVVYSKYLLSRNKELGKQRIMKFVKETGLIRDNYLTFLEEAFESDSLPFVVEAMLKENASLEGYSYRYYIQVLFNILAKYDITNYVDKVIDFALTYAKNSIRQEAISLLAKYQEQVKERALQLIAGTTVDERITGALLLSYSKEPEIQSVLLALVETEKNDDTRDIFLEAVADIKFKVNYTFDEVLQMVEFAEARNKLSKWNEKWLNEDTLPQLFWINGRQLTKTTIRFLFYRCKRSRSLSSDIEARQVFHHLDKSKSQKFALSLLESFQESNYDIKLKYYLAIAGFLGDDSVLTKLNSIFRKSITDKKFILAENVVGTLALIGTNKALRLVDMIARQLASKRPKVSEAAQRALESAALELNITPAQLSDRIIPDFGFENLYKTFTTDAGIYRAFISKDFKLHYFNDENKLKKSMPSETPKEVADELKQIEKEIKEVVKNQKGRLERFLVNEQRWTINEWTEYYLNNPIMLIYVQRLIWGVYKDDLLINIFYCDDDIELYDINDEPIHFDEGSVIGIVHPIQMKNEQIQAWKEKLYEMDFNLEFPILERKITLISEEEKHRTESLLLNNSNIPRGADFVAGFLQKKGWLKEAGDAGYLNFIKKSFIHKISAIANIEGPAAYYQGSEAAATIYEITFYDDTQKYKKISLSEVPKIFYSEVIADLRALIEA